LKKNAACDVRSRQALKYLPAAALRSRFFLLLLRRNFYVTLPTKKIKATMSIVKFRFPGLWNSEYPLVVNRIIDIVGDYDLRALRLVQSYERLAAFRPQLAKIEVQERADAESAKLSELDQQRDTLFNVIYGSAKALKRTPMPDISTHAHRVLSLFKKHGAAMPATNYTAETKRLYDMAADVEAQPELQASLEELSLWQPFERMVEINREFDALFMQRNKQQAEAEKVNVRAIREECDKAISLLWSAIEFCTVEYGAEPYAPLVSNINRLNAYYKQQLAARATRRKNKHEVDKEPPIAPPTE